MRDQDNYEVQIERLKAENARLAATIQAIADLSENSRAPAEAQIMKAIEYALGAVKNSTALHDLVDPTIDLLRRVSGHLEPYVCFESLRQDVINDINRLQGSLPP